MIGKALDAIVVVVRFVPPIEQHEIARNLGNALRVRVDDIAPDHRLLAVLLRQAPHTLDVLEKDATRPERLRALARSPPLEIEGLVAVRIEKTGSEVRQELVVEVGEQRVAPGLGRRERPAPLGFGERCVTRQRQDALHVSERLQRRNQVDEARGGVGVELAQRRRAERRGAGADFRVAAEGEGVLDVQHQDVELETHAEIDELVQRREGRDLAARDVEHDAALGEVGGVVDGAGRHATARIDELGERLHRVTQARRARAREQGPLGIHVDAMGLAVIAVAAQLDAGSEVRRPRVRLDGEARAAAALDGAAQRERRGEVRIRRALCEHDRQPLAQRERAGSAQRAARFGQKRRKLGFAAGRRHGARA